MVSPIVRRSSLFHVDHDGVEVQDLGLDHLAATEDQQLMRQPRGASAHVDDFGDVSLEGDHGFVRAEPEPAGQLRQAVRDERGIVHDPGQEVVEVMGDPAGQLSDALQPLGLVKSVLQIAKIGFGSLPVGDVTRDRGSADDRAGSVTDR